MPLLSSKVVSCLSALPLLSTLLVSSARADAYKLYAVTESQSEHFVMGDDFGDYAFTSSLVTGNTNLCGTSSLDTCYQVGNAITGTSYYSSTIPAPVADPNASSGHADLPTGPDWDIYKQLGNLFSGSYQAPNGYTKIGTWDSANGLENYLGDGSIDGGFSSANGNVFYIDGVNNTLVVGVDLQTSPVPEPATLSLTATAVIAAATFGRRRLKR